MTPLEQGLKGCFFTDWKPHTYYAVKVAFSSTNVIFNAIFYSGFLSKEGKPGAYNTFFKPTIDSGLSIHDAYYVEVISELKDVTEWLK